MQSSARIRQSYRDAYPYCDEDGKTFIGKDGVKRPCVNHEDPHHWAAPRVIYETGIISNGSNDSDTLLMADWDKHNKLCLKHFGDEAQMWGGRQPEAIQAFLRDYLDLPDLRLARIVKMRNVSNGQHIWNFQYAFTPKPRLAQ